ncbi:MAG: hypothetical protein MI755_09485 [Sphingomonadales bacterium]|nr:hypothetical protein [Sphingomonadales bacterium]
MTRKVRSLASASVVALFVGGAASFALADQAETAAPKTETGESRLSEKELKKLERQRKKAQKKAERAQRKEAKRHQKAEAKRQKGLRKQYGLGPYPDEIAGYVVDKPAELQKFYRSLFIEGERNAVLNFSRLGLAAVDTGHYRTAEWALDQALLRIESIYANDAKAKAARSKFKAEKVKDFKGEPYERAMAYLYRGLLYLRIGDYENARAAFKAGEYQDTVSGEEEFQADFAVLNYLSGWASHCNRDYSLAEESFAAALTHNPALLPPQPDDNFLLLSETGSSPVKFGDGEYSEQLKFRQGDTNDANAVTVAFMEPLPYSITEDAAPDADAASIETMIAPAAGPKLDGWGMGRSTSSPSTNAFEPHPDRTVLAELDLAMASNIYYQASTRGDRQIDYILEGKANFKETTETIGDIGVAAGTTLLATSAYSGNSDLAAAGAIVGAIGLFSSALSAAAKPEADTRYWETLPDAIHVGTAQISEATFTVSWNPASRQHVVLQAPREPCGLAWSRATSAVASEESAPNARMPWKKMRKQKKPIQEQDRVFRDWLATEGEGEGS